MALSPDQISTCEEILNKIATELILASPGSDDGLVPTYSLIAELNGALTDDLDSKLVPATSAVKTALDMLLDESSPFDQRTLDFVSTYTSWSQNTLLEERSGKDVEPLEIPSWVSIPSEDDAFVDENTNIDWDRCDDLLNQISTELVLASPGSDNGLVPVYSLLNDLGEVVHEHEGLQSAVINVKSGLDALLDNAKPFDSETLDYLGEFTVWSQTNFAHAREGEHLTDEFLTIDGNESPTVTNVETIDEVVSTTDESTPVETSTDSDSGDDLAKEIAKETDVLLELGNEDDREILSEFHTEAMEHLEQIEAALLVLENDPENEDSLAAIFRSFHTIKGVAGFLHLVPIQALAHDVESLLDLARNKKLTLNSGMITLILQSQDTIQALVDQITLALEKGHMPEEIIPVSQLIVAVKQAAKAGLEAKENGTEAVVEGVKSNKSTKASEPAKETSSEKAQEKQATKSATPTKKVTAPSGGSTASRSTIRVNTQKLDNLMDMVGELVIVQSQLSESGRMDKIDDNSPLQRNITELQRITRELQHTSMSLRLVPIKPTFQRVGRLVRDLAGSFNKKVNLVLEGEDTELDRNVVEQIGDPLIHMVRNSIDHGLESNEERIQLGKEEVGKIELKAYHQGSNIVIELSDDGKGIDPEKILAKARKNGLVPENVEPQKQEILNLIFEPGFSTAEKVTDVSGRGVGMDVVRRNIEKLRGKVEMESDVGKGTTFKIKLPLTTAIIDGMVVRVGEDKFILPTTSVQVAIRPTKKQITKIKGKTEVLDLRGKTIPLVRLHRIFSIETEVQEHHQGIVVIIETIGRPYGLLVDEMLSKQEVVIKSLGSLMHNVAGVAGGAILGDGTIALILDPFTLVNNQ
jgi:two-component system chemotaxis sensor kinase CheA